MTSKEPKQHALSGVLDPDDPAGEKRTVAWLDDDLMRQLWRGKPRQTTKFHNINTALEVLRDPERVFGGVRDGESGGRAYVGRPSHVRDRTGHKYPRNERFVFVAYLDADSNLYDWRQEPMDAADGACPRGFATRYQKQLWPPMN